MLDIGFTLQFVIIGTYVFIMAVFHAEASGDGSELYESEPFVKVPCVKVALDNRIELHDPESQLFPFCQAVQDKLFADVLSPVFG